MESWFPVAMFFVGSVFGLVLEWLRDARARGRDQEARTEARRDLHRDFQRETLISLQEWLTKLSYATGQVHDYRMEHQNKTGVWPSVPPELDKDVREANGRALHFGVRVDDEGVRTLSKAQRFRLLEVVTARSAESTVEPLFGGAKEYQRLHERIGELIRSLSQA